LAGAGRYGKISPSTSGSSGQRQLTSYPVPTIENCNSVLQFQGSGDGFYVYHIEIYELFLLARLLHIHGQLNR
jgi:hypothetical protein